MFLHKKSEFFNDLERTFWYISRKDTLWLEARSLLHGRKSGPHPFLHVHSAVCETRCGRKHIGSSCFQPPLLLCEHTPLTITMPWVHSGPSWQVTVIPPVMVR